jgi:hypothetical protein
LQIVVALAQRSLELSESFGVAIAFTRRDTRRHRFAL